MHKFLKRGLAVLAVLATAFAMYRPTPAPLLLYLTEAEAVPIGSAKPNLTPEALRALATRFNQQKFFAAFAVAPGGAFNWVGGRHSAQQARADALAACNAKGQPCTVITEIRPKGYREDFNAVSISGKAIAGGLTEKAPPDRALIYALAEDGSWAVQIAQDGWLFPQFAVKARCEKFVAQGARPLAMGRASCHVYRGKVFAVTETQS